MSEIYNIKKGKVIDVKNTKTKTDKNIYFLTVEYINEGGKFFVDVSNFGNTDLKNGDIVNFDYEIKGDFKNIKGEVTKVSDAEENISGVVEEKVGGSPQPIKSFEDKKDDGYCFGMAVKSAFDWANHSKDSSSYPDSSTVLRLIESNFNLIKKARDKILGDD